MLQELLVNLACVPIPHELAEAEQVAEFAADDIVLYHVSDTSLETAEQWIKRNGKCHQICITNEITNAQQVFFIKNGIANVLNTTVPKEIAAFIDGFLNKPEAGKGRMLALTNKENHQSLMRSTLEHFGYEAAFAGTTDEFFASIKNDAKSEGFNFYFIDLSSEELDVNAFVRGCSLTDEIRKAPLIAFKDFNGGLNIHDLTAGLNKYANYLLSIEELLSFLTDNLFRMELMHLVKQINEASYYSRFGSWSGDSIEQIYYSMKGNNILNSQHILSDEKLLKITEATTEINRSIARVSSLNWIKKIINKET